MDIRPQIAMVDDEFDIIDTYKDLLGSKYIITDFNSAESYLKYIDSFKNNPFEVVLTDFRLGGINGLEMIERTHSQNKHVPFILMSGYLDKDTTLRAHNMGAHRILAKPTAVSIIDAEIQNLIYEFEVNKLRDETKKLTHALKDICRCFDLLMSQHFTKSEINKFFIENLDPDLTTNTDDFQTYLNDLEKKLYRSIKLEEILMRQLRKKPILL
jgi:FixJ family two-component response regulator